MTNEELEKFHRLAMDNSELALLALRHGDFIKFQQLSSDAFTYEKKAALGLYHQQIEPSRSVLFRSAAYIALDNADFTEATKLYEYALEGNVPAEIADELDELKMDIDRVRTENENLIQVALTFLNSRPKPVLKEHITEALSRGIRSFEVRDINMSYVAGYLEKQFSIESEKHTTLDENYQPWIHTRKASVEKRFWERYKKFLLQKERWAPDTVDKLDDITDDVLDHLQDPKLSGDWDKRGMVVGQVQSGKTSNYTGLLCKAADYGYKILVVLAGLTNDLRAQTQLRTDIGFLGWDTQVDRDDQNAERDFGVSQFDVSPQAHYLTTSAMTGDFKTTSRQITGTNPRAGHVMMVVKKNTTVLKELIKWFADWGTELADGKRLIKDLPLLVIDDEADNASINISKDNISSINGLIRSLLSLFRQSAYVGYTATPFANVFIPLTEGEDDVSRGLNIRLKEFWKYAGKDLFPKDFIINIPPPDNYVGPKEMFGIEARLSTDPEKVVQGLPLLREVPAQDYSGIFPDKHKKSDPLPEELPAELKKAIKCFILVCAVRRARGHFTVHNSMLIHVTRFVLWQNKTATLVNRELKFYQEQIRYRQGALVNELRSLYESDFLPTTRQVSSMPGFEDEKFFTPDWEEIETQLNQAAAKIQVRAIHGDTTQDGLNFDNITSLDYYTYRKTGLCVIAVGGNKLSRGLTLEGLSVSYYLRASKMYDTLMQMGRWFGYRPGYTDLCRLYTSGELIRWYKYITVAAEELRAEFDEMKLQRKSPKNFGIKVRQSPELLSITATNKMRGIEEMELSFSDKLKETWCFRRDKHLFHKNYQHTFAFINSLGNSVPRNGQPFFWQGENNSAEVIGFLGGYQADNQLEHRKIIEYITEQQKANFLTDWTIVLITTDKNKREGLFEINHAPVKVGMTMRSDARQGKGDYYEISRSHILDPAHEYLDFAIGDHLFLEALQLTVEDWEKSTRKNKQPAAPVRPSGKNIRAKRPENRGLLLIYPLDPQPEGWTGSGLTDPVIGYAISFPKNDGDKKLKYKVNEVFMKEYDYDYDPEIDEIKVD